MLERPSKAEYPPNAAMNAFCTASSARSLSPSVRCARASIQPMLSRTRRCGDNKNEDLESLTVIRMVPIVLSLLGTRLSVPSQLFLSWFGPRGLASILFVLLILEEAEVPHYLEILTITVITVAMSILLHGVTAAPFAGLYGRFTSRMGECEENRPAVELPLREGQPTHENT